MTCCGQTRTSRFCPECGKPINPVEANPQLATLLRHVREVENRHRLEAADQTNKSVLAIDQSRKQVAQRFREQASCSERDAREWKSIGDCLEATMKLLAFREPASRGSISPPEIIKERQRLASLVFAEAEAMEADVIRSRRGKEFDFYAARVRAFREAAMIVRVGQVETARADPIAAAMVAKTTKKRSAK